MIIDYLGYIAVGAVFVVLLMGLFNMFRGGLLQYLTEAHALARGAAVPGHHRADAGALPLPALSLESGHRASHMTGR